MRDHDVLTQLRRIPAEWHRRGMSTPSEIDQIVSHRLGQRFVSSRPIAEPSYEDFFTAA